MNTNRRKAIVAAGAVLASLGALRMSSAATVIEQDSSAVIDGFNITTPEGVALTVSTDSSGIVIEKAANFTAPNQGLQIAFQPVAGASAATSIDFADETIQNNTGAAFSGFQFILLNIGSANATFSSVSNVLAPPTGFTSVSLNSAQDVLSYTGTQAAGTTSIWGSSATGDNLLIDAPSGAAFSLKELSESGGGGGTPPGGGGNAVPLPAAAWQSLASLAALGMVAVGRRMKRSMA